MKHLILILLFPTSIFSQILWDNFEDTRIGYYEFVHGGMTTRFENPDLLHTVQDIMTTDVAALKYEDTIQVAIDRMVKDGISQLPVLSNEGNILGIVSEDSILQKGAQRNGVVGQVMHTSPAIVDIGLSVSEARRRLTEVEALLVVDGDLLVGLVSRMDLVRALRLNSIA